MNETFLTYDAENPRVWELFCKYANEAINAGRRVLSANLIFERIRWYEQVETTGDRFKVNNNYRAFYARKFNTQHPGSASFKTRGPG